MTFTEIQTEIADRLTITAASDLTRIGRVINQVYRKVTTSIGLQLSRRATVQTTANIGTATITFSNVEKILNLYNRNVSPYKLVHEVTLDQLREDQPYPLSDNLTQWAVASQTADTQTIEINVTAQTGFTVYADVIAVAATLSGSNEPAFPESYHDILIDGVLMTEYKKIEKLALAKDAKGEYEQRLSDLKLWMALSSGKDFYQGQIDDNIVQGSSGGSGGAAVDGALSWTQTGLITFDRDPSAPFAVSASSAVVPNLDADKVDGYHAAELAALAENETVTGQWTINAPTDVTNIWKWTLGSSGTPVTGSTNRIWLRSDGYDTVNTADATLWSYGSLFYHKQSGGNGNRAAQVSQLEVSGSPTRSSSTNSVAHTALMFGSANDGNYFGSNPYVRVTGGTGASAIGTEINTDCQVVVVDKIGLQIVDVTASTSAPSGRNAALRLVNQASAYGYLYGLMFDNNPAQSVRTSGTLLHVVGGSYARAIDLSLGTFSGEVIYLPNAGYVAGKNISAAPVSLLGINASGEIVLGAAGNVNSIPGGRVKFPATQVPSSDANTLDDYEEGSWTPVIGGSGGTSGQTYTTQVGRYIKVGRVVTASFTALLSNKGTITTNVIISGLPFASMNEAGLDQAGYFRFGQLATNWVTVGYVITPNTQQVLVRGANAAAASNETALVTGDIGNTTYFSGTITYLADA